MRHLTLYTVLLVTLACCVSASAEPVPLYGPKWCLSFAATIGCSHARGFPNPSGEGTISPDGRSIYLPGGGASMFAVMRRNPADGTIRQGTGRAGCVVSRRGRDTRDNRARRCAVARGLAGGVRSLAVSPDGRHVYATAGRSLAIFARAPSGRLEQLGGAAGCVVATAVDGCAVEPRFVAVSVSIAPDGASVYTGGETLTAFAREPATGALTRVGCLSRRRSATHCTRAPFDAAISAPTWAPDGRVGYAAAFRPNPDGLIPIYEVLLSLARDPLTGAVSAIPGGCLSGQTVPGCTLDARFSDGPEQLLYTTPALTPDATTVYVSGFPGSYNVPVDPDTPFVLAGFSRAPDTGALVPLPGACLHTAAVAGCVRDRRLPDIGPSVFSPSGDRMYTLASRELVELVRDPVTGAIRRVGRVRTCDAPGPCVIGRSPLGGENGLLIAPDGGYLYGIASDFWGTGTIATLALG